MDEKQYQSQTNTNAEPVDSLKEPISQNSSLGTQMQQAPNMNGSYVSQQPTLKFPIGRLLFIILGPGALLVLTLIIQMVVRFMFTSVDGGGGSGGGIVVKIINLITILLGFISVVGIILIPIFIILLVVGYNKKKNQQ